MSTCAKRVRSGDKSGARSNPSTAGSRGRITPIPSPSPCLAHIPLSAEQCRTEYDDQVAGRWLGRGACPHCTPCREPRKRPLMRKRQPRHGASALPCPLLQCRQVRPAAARSPRSGPRSQRRPAPMPAGAARRRQAPSAWQTAKSRIRRSASRCRARQGGAAGAEAQAPAGPGAAGWRGRFLLPHSGLGPSQASSAW